MSEWPIIAGDKVARFKQINQSLHNVKWMLNVPKNQCYYLVISSTSIPFLKLLVLLKKRKSFYYVLLTDCRHYVFRPTPLWGGDVPHSDGVRRTCLTLSHTTQQLTQTCPARFNLQREQHSWQAQHRRAARHHKPERTASAGPCAYPLCILRVALPSPAPSASAHSHTQLPPLCTWAQKCEAAADHMRFGRHCSLQRSCPTRGCLIMTDLHCKEHLPHAFAYLLLQVAVLSRSSPLFLQWKWYLWVSLNGTFFNWPHYKDSKAVNQARAVNVSQLVPLMLSTRLFCYISLPFVTLCSEMVGWNLPYL